VVLLSLSVAKVVPAFLVPPADVIFVIPIEPPRRLARDFMLREVIQVTHSLI
jgi:hypothetical protein